MTTVTTPSAFAAPRAVSRARQISSRVFLAVPALAAAAFGGHLLVTGWATTRGGGAHHVQDLAWGALEGILLLVGLLAALGRPVRRPAVLAQVLAVIAALLVTMALTAQLDAFTLVLTALVVTGVALSPARPLLTASKPRVDVPTAVLAAAAAVALVPYAIVQAAEQRRDADVHAELIGYTGATAWALGTVTVLAVASLWLPGRRLVALSAAAAAAVVGLASVIWPDDASSLGAAGGAACLALAMSITALSFRRRKS